MAKKNGDTSIIDFDAYKGYEFKAHYATLGFDVDVAFSDDSSQYGPTTCVITHDDCSNGTAQCQLMIPAIISDSFAVTSGNFTCALGRTIVGPANWEQMMKECREATGLTDAEIYRDYDADFVMSFDTVGLANTDFVDTVMGYLSDGSGISVVVHDGNGNYNEIIYTIEKTITIGSK